MSLIRTALTKDGHYKHMPFYGFVTLEGARTLAGAIPVKLDARAYTLEWRGISLISAWNSELNTPY